MGHSFDEFSERPITLETPAGIFVFNDQHSISKPTWWCESPKDPALPTPIPLERVPQFPKLFRTLLEALLHPQLTPRTLLGLDFHKGTLNQERSRDFWVYKTVKVSPEGSGGLWESRNHT